MNLKEAVFKQNSPAANRRWVELLRTQEGASQTSYTAAIAVSGGGRERGTSKRHLDERRAFK